jgi:hypothetical protein
MPRVEAYGPRRVQSRPLPNTSVDTTQAVPSAAALGGAAAQGLESFGQQTTQAGFGLLAESNRMAEDAKRRADQLAVLTASNQLDTFVNGRLYAPQEGALSVKGKDAMGLGVQVGTEFDNIADTIGSKLSNPDQKAAFLRERFSTRQRLNETLRRHESTERQQWDLEETNKGIENARNDAIAGAADPLNAPLKIKNALDRQAALIGDFATHNGLGPEARKAQLDEARTNTHVGVIGAFVSAGQDRKAQAYFDEVKDQIAGPKRAEAMRLLEAGSVLGESQRQSDRIMATMPTEDEALKAARAIEEPKVRDAVEARVIHEWGLRNQANHAAHEQSLVTAGNLIDQNPRLGTRAIPPALWASLTVDQKENFERYAKRLIDPAGVKTDWNTFYDLLTLGSNEGTREKFAQIYLADPKYRSKLGNAEFKQLAELQASIRKGDMTNANKLLVSERTQSQIADQALLSIGFDPTPAQPGTRGYSKENTDRVIAFRRALREAVATKETQTGKHATDEEVQAIADTLVTPTGSKVTKPHTFWWDTTGPTFAFESPVGMRSRLGLPSHGAVTALSDIPAQEQQQIQAALIKAGKPVTAAAVVALYNLARERMAR